MYLLVVDVHGYFKTITDITVRWGFPFHDIFSLKVILMLTRFLFILDSNGYQLRVTLNNSILCANLFNLFRTLL